MCNAWNHSPGCNCGWGGGSNGGGGHVSTRLSKSLAEKIKDAETYPTTCWWCGETVYYHSNGFGDSVLFDSLGSPWQVHSCWKVYWNQEKIQRQGTHSNSVENTLIIQILDKSLILAGAIKSVNKVQSFATEEQVASYLGISQERLREEYSHLYVCWAFSSFSRLIRMKLDEC